MKSRHQESIAK